MHLSVMSEYENNKYIILYQGVNTQSQTCGLPPSVHWLVFSRVDLPLDVSRANAPRLARYYEHLLEDRSHTIIET